MTKYMKALIKKLLIWVYYHTRLGIEIATSDIRLPDNIYLAERIADPEMRFNLVLGFDVKTSDEGQLGVCLNSMVFSSDGEKAMQYIQKSSESVVKDTAALFATVAAKQIACTDSDSYKRATVSPNPVSDPVDSKALLN